MMPIEKVIRDRLVELCPQLYLDGFDKVVWMWCKQDMYAYLQYLKKHQTIKTDETTDAFITYVELFYFGKMMVDASVMRTLPSLHIVAKECDAEFREWAYMWIGKWWKKFNQRVKLKFNLPKKHLATDKIRAKGNTVWMDMSQKERNYIVDRAMKTLIAKDEICCPMLVAINATRLLLGKRKSVKKKWAFEDTVNFASMLVTHLGHVVHSNEAFIFIFPTKEAYMSEQGSKSGNVIV